MSTEKKVNEGHVTSRHLLKPLHKTFLFWLIIILTIFTALFSAHAIYPIQCWWDLRVLKKAPELFKSPMLIAGAGLSILTIYSIAFRSHETNKQHLLSNRQYELSTKQFVFTTLNIDRQKLENERDEFFSLLVYIMRIQERYGALRQQVDSYLKLLEVTKEEQMNTAKKFIIDNLYMLIDEIKNLNDDMYSNHKMAISRIPFDIHNQFDSHITSLATFRTSLELSAHDNLVKTLTVAKTNIKDSDLIPIETSARELADKTSQELNECHNKIINTSTISK